MLELHDQPNGDGSLFSPADSNIISQSLNNSCDHCRNRKIKCNSAKPSCSYCSRRSLPCTYSINKKKQIFSGAPLKISLNELEERIQRLEILSSNILLQQQQQRNIAYNHQIPTNVTFIPDQVHSRDWSQTPLYSAIPFNPTSTCLSPTQLPECPNSLPVAFTSEPLSMNYSTDTSCLPLNLNQAPNQVGGYHNFNSSFSMSHDLLGIEDLRRILLASYRSKGEFKGFANYHKSVLIELCLSSNLVMASFCALSCAHASFPFLDRSPATRRRLIDHFLSHAKSLLVQEGYSNPSIATIQAVLLIGIVEYEKGRFERCISYHQSAFCMACVVGLPQLDVARMGTVTSEGATERKMWWEIFTMERCVPFMLYEERGVIPEDFQVMLADSQGCSLGIMLEELEVFHACCFMKDPDPVWRLLPVVRLKMLNLLWRAHSLAVKASRVETLSDYDQQQLIQLQQDLSAWASFASPNPFIGNTTSIPVGGSAGGNLNSPGSHPVAQASLVILFNCAYILAYSPTLYRHNHPESPYPYEDNIPDSCGVAAGHVLDGIVSSKPENPRGERWHQLLPFFSYAGCLVYYRLYVNRPHNPAAQKTAFERFQALYLELALSLPLFPVADVFMAKLRPLRDSMEDQSP